MSITVTGTPEQQQALASFITRAEPIMGHCIEPVEVIVTPRDRMPFYAPGEHARGYWKSGPHHILIADDTFDPTKPDLAAKTLGHELVHTMQDDWFVKWHRKSLLPYLHPKPDNWTDPTIAGKFVGYTALPYECIATWGSAALFGWSKPAYSTLYDRKIVSTDFVAVAKIMVTAK